MGNIKKCDDDNTVRCCGASASFVVGKSKVTTEAPRVANSTTQVPQPDILSRLNDEDVLENEIPYVESEDEVFTSTLSDRDVNTEVPSSINEAKNLANFHQKQHLNDEIDEEPAESESITETVSTELQRVNLSFDGAEGTTENEESDTEVIPTVILLKNHRQPKNLDNVMMVYPNFMSGIPKTTPKNMPETNEMTMFDKEIGMDLHLVFSKTTIKPEIPVLVEPSSTANTINSTNKKPLYQFAKRRRQYKPIKLTTESTVEEAMELKPTTVSSRTVTRQSNKIRRRPSSEEPTNSTTKPSQAKLSMRVPIMEEEEILHTSEDDKSHQSRFRLFNARHRLNYLRRSTTTTTTESPTEMTTLHTSQPKTIDRKRPLRVNENRSKNPVSGRPSQMNVTLVRVMDTNHRNMISKVRVALKAASTENQMVEIPRSFASADMHNRVKKIEKMLVNEMINVYTETKTKRRGDQSKTKEQINIRNNLQVNTTEKPISKPTTNSTRHYRGKKKFESSDLLDKTLIVPMSSNEVRRMRVRSTTVRPAEDITIPTTRKSRRRVTTTVQPSEFVQTLDENKTMTRDSNLSAIKEERNSRRRISMRRRYTVDPSTSITTTYLPPVRTTSENVDTRRYSTTTPTISTVFIETTTTTPETTTTLSQTTTEFSAMLNQDEFIDKLSDESQDESTQIEEIGTTIPTPKETPEILSDFKPSPLWSITSDEKNDFNLEQNHSYDMDGIANEKTLRNGHRRSRNSQFEPPVNYLNGFVPVSSIAGPIKIIGPIPKPNKLGDDAKVRYNLPRDSKAHFSKN